MSSFEINGQPLQRADLRMSRYRAWSADLDVGGPMTVADGSRVSLTIGDMVLSGTKVSGGSWVYQTSFTVIGGAAGWEKPVPSRQYRDDSGVLLSAVATDLATEVGETIIIPPALDRPLGYAWIRPEGLASAALDALVGPEWWVDAAGVTQVGPRPSSVADSSTLAVSSYDPARKRATVASETDSVAQLQPGATLADPGFETPLVITEAVFRVTPGKVEVDLSGERPTSELFAAIVDSRAPTLRSLYPYQVTEDPVGRPSLQPMGAQSASLPQIPYVDEIPGLPGATARLAPGAIVLVSFQGGDPGSPFVEGFLGGTLPITVGLNAEVSIVLGGPTATPMALATPTDAAIAALTAKVNAIAAALPVPIPPLPPLPSTAASKVFGA